MNLVTMRRATGLWRIVVIAGILSLGTAAIVLIFDTLDSPSPLNIFAVEVALFALLGVVFYARSRSADTEAYASEGMKANRSGSFFLVTSFTLAVTVAVWQLWQSLYVPSPLYYVALSVALALVGAEVFHVPVDSRRWRWILLGQMIVMGTLIQVSFPWLNPKTVISDPYFHWLGIDSILQTGRVPLNLGYYFYFPFFHVLNAIILEAADLGFLSYAMINHALMITVIPFSYLLAGEVVSHRKALLATILILVSPFFFLLATSLPVLLGADIMILAVFALLRYRKRRTRRWWITFWALCVFVFFSHPVNAMVLAGILAVYWANHRLHSLTRARSGFTAPTATYTVSYLGYLVFLAVNALALFVQSLVDSGPKYYFARIVEATAIPPEFVTQTVSGTIGFSTLSAFAAFALLSWLFKGRWNQRLVLGVLFILVLIPSMVVLFGKGPYGLQAARTLLYLNILVVVPAGWGLHYAVSRHPSTTVKTLKIGVVIFLVALLSSTSYLTGNGNRFLSDSIPIQTSYITDSMIEAREYLLLIPDEIPLALDPALATSMAPDGVDIGYLFKPYSIDRFNWVHFTAGFGNASVALAISEVWASNSGYEAPNTAFLDDVYGARAYDNGIVRVYTPRGD